jgi:hypothetical protein
MPTSEVDYIPADPDAFYEAGTEALEVFPLEGESIESGTWMSGDAKLMSPADLASWAGQIRFINSTTAKLLVVAIAQENTQALYDVEVSLSGPQGWGLSAAVRNLQRDFPAIHVLSTLDTQLDEMDKSFRLNLDVPKGAEGFSQRQGVPVVCCQRRQAPLCWARLLSEAAQCQVQVARMC